jgi:hypothetical protein
LRYLAILLVLTACAGAADEGTSPDARSDTAPEATLADAPTPDAPPAEASVEAAPELPARPEPVRFAVISDTHLTANRFATPNVHLRDLGPVLAALTPRPEHVFATGDDLEDLMCSPDMLVAKGGSLLLDVYRAAVDEAFGTNALPFHLALGNHDVRFFDTFHPEIDTLTPWLTTMAGSGAFPAPWYVVEERGVAFVVLDSRGGATSYDENDAGTLGDAQLAWLGQQLDRGLPSVLFWHHDTFAPLATGTGLEPAWAVIEAHPGVVRALFVGHGHYYLKGERAGVTLVETVDLKSGVAPGYVLAEIDPVTGQVTLLNDADIPWGTLGTP